MLQNITPKDDESLLIAPANMIHSYQVQLKRFDAQSPDDPEHQCIGYEKGDRVWVKFSNW